MTDVQEALHADPCSYLNDDCMKHVLSFVGGKVAVPYNNDFRTNVKQQRRRKSRQQDDLPGPGPYWSVKEAAKFCSTLSSVSREWKRVVDKSISSVVSVPLDVNLDEFGDNEQAMEHWVSWLCRHKPLIGNFQLRQHWPNLTHQFTQLFQACDTSRLTVVRLQLSLCDPPDSAAQREQQHELQTVIAQQCPNLKELSVFVTATGAAAAEEEETTKNSVGGFLAPSLLTLPAVRKSEVWLIVANKTITDKDGMALNALVKDLSGVRQLDKATLQLISLRTPTELLFEPIVEEPCAKKCALGLATAGAFFK